MFSVRSKTKQLLLAVVLTVGLSAIVLSAGGCGTTRWTDTKRTGTEQLMISDAIDRAVSRIDFSALAGREIFFDASYLAGVTDQAYLVSTLRQHMLASGCLLKEKREDATYVVEARSGAVGTDRHDLLYGVPATNIGGVMPLPGVPQSIPEIPLAKKTVQRGVVKLAVFAFNRETGRPLWQSGIKMASNDAKDLWILGAGPFQHGSVYPKTSFAGREIRNPLSRRNWDDTDEPIWVGQESYFEPERQIAQRLPHRLPNQAVAVKPKTRASNKAKKKKSSKSKGTKPKFQSPKYDSRVRRASATEPLPPSSPAPWNQPGRPGILDLPYGAPIDIKSVVPSFPSWPEE